MELKFLTFNLAPWKYRNANYNRGGPIAKVEIVYTKDRFFEATSFLHPSVLPQKPSGDEIIYGGADGTGTDKFSHIAKFKAISEALERWAFFSVSTLAKFGFDHDPTTTGMAAWPSFSSRPARARALCEAYERWCLCEWWESKLKHELTYPPLQLPELDSQLRFIRIIGPIRSLHTLLVVSESPTFVCYGFACRSSIQKAALAAVVEMQRNRFVLNRYFSTPLQLSPSNLSEKRLLFFSSSIGYNLFRTRERQEVIVHQDKPLALIVDEEIKGPWSVYAHVWRCLLPAHPSALKPDAHYFLF